MIEFTPRQNRTVAAGITVLSFAVILAFVIFVLHFAWKCLSFLSPALTPVILGLFLSMLFKPYYEWFRLKVRNPTVALLLMLGSIALPISCLMYFSGAAVISQVIHFVHNAPTVATRLSTWVNVNYPNAQALLSQFGMDGDGLLCMFLNDPTNFTKTLISTLGTEYGADAMKAGVGILKSLSGVASMLLSALFFGFFLTRPVVKGDDYVRQLPFLKIETRAFVARQIDSFCDIITDFFRRQVVICLIEGILYGLGFMLVDLPYGFLIGFMLGSLNLVPFLGTILCLPIALPIAYFADGGSVLRLVLVISVWLAGQLLDGYLITPKIQGEKTGLGYAGVIFSFIFWGVVFHSMLGLLLAIPLSAFCVVLWRVLKQRYIRGVI